MHTKDKRAYYLGDSVYSSIKACDGFAMEIDPAEAIDTALANKEYEKLDIEYRKEIENDLVQKGPDYYKERQKEFNSMLVKMRKKFENTSLRDINRLERAYRRRAKNDMKTRLDLYLFDLAKTQGKIVGAVEDLVDQTSIKHEKDAFDSEEFIKSKKKKYADFMEWMIETYCAAELDEMDEFSKVSNSREMLTILLYNRNDKMARRIDSLGNIRSSFCAVGSAHLPGDSGVINLLRKRGFTVTPVFSSKKIEPGEIVIENKMQALIEISDADSNYIVKMPGRPTDFVSITKKLVVKTYKELSNEILLMCGVYEDGKLYRTADKVKDEIKDFFTRYSVKLYDTKKINRQDIEGYEMSFKHPEGYIRLHLFCSNGKTYMFGAGSKNKDSMNAFRCQNFLSSYIMMFNRPVHESSFISFSNTEKAFGIGLPSMPKKENVEGDDTYTNEDITLFSCIDAKKKTSYLILIKEPFKGYFPGLDSNAFTQTINEIKKGVFVKYSEPENVLLDGLPALKVKIIGEADSKRQYIHIIMAMRQNRFYCVTARGLAVPENDSLFTTYFNGFHFLPYQTNTFQTQKSTTGFFSVKAPAAIEMIEPKKINAKNKEASISAKKTEYYSFDSCTAASYDIMSLYLGKYYWADGEMAFLEDYSLALSNDSLAVNNVYNNDSLIYKRNVCNGSFISREILLRSIQNNSLTRIRIIHYADSAFLVYTKGDKEFVTNENADTFFNSFRFTDEKYASAVFHSKTQLLLTDLQSKDSNTCAGAMDALKQGFKFPDRDMPLLLNALLHDFSNTKFSNYIPELLAQAIATRPGKEVFDFIATNYPLLKNKKEHIRMQMFNILSEFKTKEAYELLKVFLLTDEPSPSNYDIALSNFSHYPSLAVILFPELAVKIKDTYMAPDVLEIANMLIDSNKLSCQNFTVYEEDILVIAKKMLKQYQASSYSDFYAPHIEAIIKLLVKMNQKKGNDLLDDFLSLQNHALSNVIFIAKVKSNQPLLPDALDKYCEDPNRRIELYDQLFKLGKQSYFKCRYATQQSFAEAFATIYTNSQISPRISKDYDIVAVKEEIINAVLSRYYIIKVKCHFIYENISYTSIIGPFAPNESNFSIPDGKEKFILYKSKFDKNEIESLFADFISKIRSLQ
jgi:uncharacterized protein YbaP (TraB family)